MEQEFVNDVRNCVLPVWKTGGVSEHQCYVCPFLDFVEIDCHGVNG